MSGTASIPVAGPSRLISLDLLRLLAIVMVLGRHMDTPPSDLPGPLKAGLDVWFINGGQGVDLFFVLSGFLISGLLFAEYKKHGDISVKRFYWRRAWKIYPAFYFLIGFTVLCQLLVVGERLHSRRLINELLFLQSYSPGLWPHTWSLAVEEHFYIFLPLLLLFLVRRGGNTQNPFRSLPYLVVTTSIGLLAVRMLNFWLRSDYSNHKFAFATHLRIDALLFGVGIAYAYHFHGEWFRRTFRPWRHVLILAGIAALVPYVAAPPPRDFYLLTFGFTQFYLGAAALLVGVLMCEIGRNRLTVALAALGAASYSIYLWHMALATWALPRLTKMGTSWEVRTTIYMAGAVAIGVAMAKLLELPALRYRDRRFPSRSTALAEADMSAPAEPRPRRRAA